MFITRIFQRYRERQHRTELIRALIEKLPIDTMQKELYLEAIAALSDEAMEQFYQRLIGVVESIELSLSDEKQRSIVSTLSAAQKEEYTEQQKQRNGLETLLSTL